MIKAQSFGFDVLLTVTAVLVFGQLFYLYSVNSDPSLLLIRRVENDRLLHLVLVYNNSLALFDSYYCNNNVDSLGEFNKSVYHILDSYVNNREYLLIANNLVYSSEGVSSVCLEKATPAVFEIDSSCNTILRFEFSVYTRGEKTTC